MKMIIPGSFSPERTGCETRSDRVEIVVDKVAKGQIFLLVFWFPLSLPFHQSYIITFH